jgi:hypothetical protein
MCHRFGWLPNIFAFNAAEESDPHRIISKVVGNAHETADGKYKFTLPQLQYCIYRQLWRIKTNLCDVHVAMTETSIRNRAGLTSLACRRDALPTSAESERAQDILDLLTFSYQANLPPNP